MCVCVCVERERESFLHQIQLSSMGKIWKSKVTVGGGVDSKFECIYFLFSNGLYFFAYSGCARTNFDLSNLLHVTILLESLRLKI